MIEVHLSDCDDRDDDGDDRDDDGDDREDCDLLNVCDVTVGNTNPWSYMLVKMLFVFMQ